MQEAVYSTGQETWQLLKAILIYTKRGLIKDMQIICFLVFQARKYLVSHLNGDEKTMDPLKDHNEMWNKSYERC